MIWKITDNETGLIIASVVFWCIRGGDFYAFSLFCHVIAVFYTIVLGFTVDKEERSLLRDVSFGGFGAFDDLCYQIVTKLQKELPSLSIKRVYCVTQERDLRKSSPHFRRQRDQPLVPYKLSLAYGGW